MTQENDGQNKDPYHRKTVKVHVGPEIIAQMPAPGIKTIIQERTERSLPVVVGKWWRKFWHLS
jgi:hypothetical protein